MQNFSLTTIKTPQNRLEDVQKLRALYSSSEARRPSNNGGRDS
jgi:hypothetical protein